MPARIRRIVMFRPDYLITVCTGYNAKDPEGCRRLILPHIMNRSRDCNRWGQQTMSCSSETTSGLFSLILQVENRVRLAMLAVVGS